MPVGKGAGEQNDEGSFEGTSFGLLHASESLLRRGRQFGNLGSETSSEDVEYGRSVTRVAGSEPVLFGTKL